MNTRSESNKQSILIVDDSKTNILTLAELLKEEWIVKVATNGKAALRIAETFPQPDIILLDVMMPEMDGYEVCKVLKSSPETKDIPVIFITAMAQERHEEYGLSLGAIDYISKPFSPSLVKARIRNHLELKKYRDILKESSMIDGLTGIANRRRFNEYLSMEWQRAMRRETDIALIMLDIDNFKKYNDTYGHLEGDECLKKVAESLSKGVKRASDLVARWGGEEFACLLPETSMNAALEMAEDFRANVEGLKIPHKSSQVAKVVTISIGVASIVPKQEQAYDLLLQQADKALYTAKDLGRNRVVAFS